MKNIKRGLAVIAAAALITGYAVSAQGAAPGHPVRASDFTTGGDDGFANSDTRATGHYDFLEEGIRLYTEGNTSTDKVAEYFPLNKALSGITDVEYDWYGTSPSPGIQYVMDFDNDGTQDGILVGEKVYGGQDVWLTNGSKADYKDAGAPSNTGGSGTPNHGTLAQWSAMYPNAKVLFGGFSLGSGVLGDGVLRSLSYGPGDANRYVFTDEAPTTEPPVVNPAGSTTHSVSGRTGTVFLKTAAVPEGSKAGQLPSFKVTINDSTRSLQTPAPGTVGTYTLVCPKNVQCVFKTYRNGTKIDSFTIRR
jgi:hypothetical protein